MNVKELRSFTNFNQQQFAQKYHVPLQTLKQWESSADSKSYRKPPEYVLYLLKQTIMTELTNQMLADFKKYQSLEKRPQSDELSAAAKELWG